MRIDKHWCDYAVFLCHYPKEWLSTDRHRQSYSLHPIYGVCGRSKQPIRILCSLKWDAVCRWRNAHNVLSPEPRISFKFKLVFCFFFSVVFEPDTGTHRFQYDDASDVRCVCCIWYMSNFNRRMGVLVVRSTILSRGMSSVLVIYFRFVSMRKCGNNKITKQFSRLRARCMRYTLTHYVSLNYVSSRKYDDGYVCDMCWWWYDNMKMIFVRELLLFRCDRPTNWPITSTFSLFTLLLTLLLLIIRITTEYQFFLFWVVGRRNRFYFYSFFLLACRMCLSLSIRLSRHRFSTNWRVISCTNTWSSFEYIIIELRCVCAVRALCSVLRRRSSNAFNFPCNQQNRDNSFVRLHECELILMMMMMTDKAT